MTIISLFKQNFRNQNNQYYQQQFNTRNTYLCVNFKISSSGPNYGNNILLKVHMRYHGNYTISEVTKKLTASITPQISNGLKSSNSKPRFSVINKNWNTRNSFYQAKNILKKNDTKFLQSCFKNSLNETPKIYTKLSSELI